jgi:hypothetical protein
MGLTTATAFLNDTGQFEYFLGLTFHFVIRSVNIGQGVASFP